MIQCNHTGRFKFKDGKRYIIQILNFWKAGVTILITGKMNFRANKITRDKRDII